MESREERYLGLILREDLDRGNDGNERLVEGQGRILGTISGDQLSSGAPNSTFGAYLMRSAGAALVRQYLAMDKGASWWFDIGRATFGDETARVLLRPQGFKRHTFLCGQTGSGKTFALGVILERLLLYSDLRIVILDPNSDFVRFGELQTLKEINRTRSQKLAGSDFKRMETRLLKIDRKIKVLAPRASNGRDILHLRFSDLQLDEQGVLLGLDPLRDREEYGRFLTVIEQCGGAAYSLQDIMEAIRRFGNTRALEARLRNLGIGGWGVWCSGEGESIIEVLKGSWQCLIVDIGSLESEGEKAAVAMAVLGHLWRNRRAREQVLVVIDEAHELCPQTPASKLEEIVSGYVTRMAGEGRKFGLSLFLASQRPGKIHRNALQYDSLVLMRVNSTWDIEELVRSFGGVPESLMRDAFEFERGRALVAGEIVGSPTVVEFEGRLMKESGRDLADFRVLGGRGRRSAVKKNSSP